MRYFTILRGNTYCLVKQCNHGPRFWLMKGGRYVGYKHAKNASSVAACMAHDDEGDTLLSGEVWVEETTVVQGGAGVPRFGGASA